MKTTIEAWLLLFLLLGMAAHPADSNLAQLPQLHQLQ
jgi:hypothetical protein